ncbi:hypothetical protein [Croceicoccus sediminis]|uniref:hypothetical protein n=1 Tax=Croceicoccus sediminis TaxID=2571150 RepID=UPI0011836831|nr:hypothetical protein [Croceicoccus sediminis]
MFRNLRPATIAVPLMLALSLAACGDPTAQDQGETDASMSDQPGVEVGPVTQGQAQAEAKELALRLASGDLASSEAAVALEDLDRVINDNIVEFPEDMRAGLSEDVASARDALTANDMEGLQEAATRIESKLSGSAATPAAS